MSTRSIPSDRLRGIIAAALLVAGFAALYAFTAQRGLSWGDSGVYQYRMMTGDLPGPYGLATAHPSYIFLGRLLSGLAGSTARFWAMNAMSGLFMALAIGGFFCCAVRYCRSVHAAALAAMTLGCAHMAWWLSCLAEVYTLSLCLLAAETACLLHLLRTENMRGFLLLALLNGLHFSVHNFALLALPVYGTIFVWRVSRCRPPLPRLLATAVGSATLWLLGAAPLLALAVRHYRLGHGLQDTVVSVLLDHFGAQVSGLHGVSATITAFNFALAALSFTLPCWLAPILRLRTRQPQLLHRPPFSRETAALLALFGIHFLFWVRYRVADQATFILPTLFFAALFLSRALVGIRRPVAWGVATAACAVLVPILAARGLNAFAPSSVRPPLPFRNDWNYFAIPWKNTETSAAKFAEAAIRELPPGAFVYTDCNDIGPLACTRQAELFPGDIWFSLPWANLREPPATPSSRWEVRPFGAYRIAPPEATIVKRKTFYEVKLP